VNCDAGEINDVATVMVSLALDRSNDARLEITEQWAKRFEACVIGIT
jgi:hypothetical protein